MNKLFTKIRSRLVDDVNGWYRHWSMRLAALISILLPFLLQSPDIIMQVLRELPPEMKTWLPAWLSPLMFGLIFFARYWAQPKKDGK